MDVDSPILSEGEGALQGATLNVGSWNSLHTGSSGSGDGGPGLFYESDIYATLGLAFESLSLATTYTAYTYPAPDFAAIHEIAIKGTFAHMLSPYGLVAIEFADCDGCPKGTYVELGIGPSFALSQEDGGPTLAVPVKIGIDAKDYYGGDAFGFFSVGGTVTIPMGETSWGSWLIKGGAEVLMLSETLEALNANGDGDTSKTGFVGFGGIGFSF